MSVVANVVEYAQSIARAGVAAALAFSIGTQVDDSNRVGCYADVTAAAEKLTFVVGGVTGPSLDRTGSQVIVTGLVVQDSSFTVTDNGDPTKWLTFQCGSLTSGFGLTIDVGAQAANRTLSVPVLGGNRTLAVIDQAQTWSGTQAFAAITATSITNSGLTAGGVPIISTGGLFAYTTKLLWNDSTGRLTVLRIGQFGDSTNTGVVQLDGAAATTRLMQWLTAGSVRWDMRANSTAESGSNAGTDFQLTAYTDAGSTIDSPLTIARVAGGQMTVTRPTFVTSTADKALSVGGATSYNINSLNTASVFYANNSNWGFPCVFVADSIGRGAIWVTQGYSMAANTGNAAYLSLTNSTTTELYLYKDGTSAVVSTFNLWANKIALPHNAGSVGFSVANTTDATSSTAAGVTFASGLAVAKGAYVGTFLSIGTTATLTQATGTTLVVSSTDIGNSSITGSAVFGGGIGMAGSLYSKRAINGGLVSEFENTGTGNAFIAFSFAQLSSSKYLSLYYINDTYASSGAYQAGSGVIEVQGGANGLGIYLRSGGPLKIYDSGGTAQVTFGNAGALTLSSTLTVNGATVTLADACNLVVNATTGTKIGTATGQKLAFWNATPVIQPASASQAAVSTTAATNTTPYGFTTAAQADGIVTLLNAIRSALVTTGIIKGAA